jgi:hypothetical protein
MPGFVSPSHCFCGMCELWLLFFIVLEPRTCDGLPRAGEGEGSFVALFCFLPDVSPWLALMSDFAACPLKMHGCPWVVLLAGCIQTSYLYDNMFGACANIEQLTLKSANALTLLSFDDDAAHLRQSTFLFAHPHVEHLCRLTI